MRRSLIIAVAATLACAGQSPAVFAHEQQVSGFKVFHAWARAAATGKNGAVYISSITTTGDEPDRLISVETPVAERAELHTHAVVEGVSQMVSVKAVSVEPGEPVILRPSGTHIMLIKLKRSLPPYDNFPLTLKFEKAGAVVVSVMVEEETTVDPRHEEPGS